MSATKIVVIVLVLIVVLFIVLAVWGATQEQSVDRATDKKKFESTDHPQLQSLGEWLSPFSPKLDAKQLQPSQTTFDLRLRPSYEISVLPDSTNKFRQAKFKASPDTCAQVSFDGQSSEAPDLDTQPNPQNPKPHNLSVVVPEEGGRITVKRELPLNNGPCTVQLQ
jgi:hypothetical protein